MMNIIFILEGLYQVANLGKAHMMVEKNNLLANDDVVIVIWQLLLCLLDPESKIQMII